MNLWDLIAGLRRRWYLTIAMVLVCLGAVVGTASVVGPSYQAEASMVLLAPKSAADDVNNPYLSLGNLGSAVDVLSQAVNTGNTQDGLKKVAPDAEAEVASDPYSDAPILILTAKSSSKQQTLTALEYVIKQSTLQLEQLQRNPTVANSNSQITAKVIARDAKPKVVQKSRVRLVAAAGLGSLILGVLLVLGIDDLLTRRRIRRRGAQDGATAATTDVEPDVEPDAKSDAKSDTDSDAKSDAESDAEPDVEPEVEPEVASQTAPQTPAHPEPVVHANGRRALVTAPEASWVGDGDLVTRNGAHVGPQSSDEQPDEEADDRHDAVVELHVAQAVAEADDADEDHDPAQTSRDADREADREAERSWSAEEQPLDESEHDEKSDGGQQLDHQRRRADQRRRNGRRARQNQSRASRRLS